MQLEQVRASFGGKSSCELGETREGRAARVDIDLLSFRAMVLNLNYDLSIYENNHRTFKCFRSTYT